MKTPTFSRPTGLLAIVLLSFLAALSQAQHQDGGTVTIRRTVYARCGCDGPQTVCHEDVSSSTPSASATPANTGRDIAIGNFTLHGVFHDPTDLLECYELPTPTASFPRIAVNVEHSAVVTATPADVSNIIFLYMNAALSRPAYLGSYVSGGGQTLIDISANATIPGLPVVLSDESSLVLGDDGIRWFSANCTEERWIEVPNMLLQIEQTVLAKRNADQSQDAETTFLVEIELDKGKGAEDIRPSLAYGADACPLVGAEMREDGDLLTWQCEYPTTNPAERACDASLSNLTSDYPAPGVGASDPLNALALIGALFSQSTSPSLVDLFPGGPSGGLIDASVLLGHAFDSLSAALGSASSAICNALHEGNALALVLAGDDFGTRTIGNFAGVPPTSISVNLATGVPVSSSPPRQPTRQVYPSETGFPSETVSGYATDITIIASDTTIVVVGTPSVTSTWEPAQAPEDSNGESEGGSPSETEPGSGGAQSASMGFGSTNTPGTSIVRSIRSTIPFIAAESTPAAMYTPMSTPSTQSIAEPTISPVMLESESGPASSILASESALFGVTDLVSSGTLPAMTVGSDSLYSIPPASVVL